MKHIKQTRKNNCAWTDCTPRSAGGAMDSVKNNGRPILTMTCFAEFMCAAKRAKNSLAKAESTHRTIRRGRKSVEVGTKSAGGLSLSRLSLIVPCRTCGDRYNGSTAPIEPEKYCSRQCEEYTMED